jgi:hypothetical protein
VERPRPAIASEARERTSGYAATPLDVSARLHADRAALHTQLVALEAYYGLTTAELVTRLGGDMLPAGIARGEAARWAELHATLERMALQAVQEQAAIEQSEENPVPRAVRLRAA